MGGNANINGFSGESLQIGFMTDLYIQEFMKFMYCKFAAYHSPKFLFSGSAGMYVRDADQFKNDNKLPILINDFDVMINEKYKEEFIHDLEENYADNFGVIILLEIQKGVKQTITIFDIMGKKVQVDFSFVPFDGFNPDRWALFAKNSDINDARVSIKGVFHKLLCRAVTALSVETFPSGETRNTVVFSVDRGWRNYDSDVYSRDVNAFFGRFDLSTCYSFVDLAYELSSELMETRKIVFNGFLDLLFGNKAQKLNRDIYIDIHYKRIALKYLFDEFNLDDYSQIEAMELAYYERKR